MNLVLAVEPDTKQAELLRRIVPALGDVELMLVNSAEAVASTVTRRVPRLLLLGASLSDQARALAVDHYILASDSGDPPVLAIPPLSNGEPTGRGKTRRKAKATSADVEVFTAAITRCLAPGHQQPHAKPLTEPEADEEVFLEIDSLADAGPLIDAAAHAAALATAQELAEARLAAEVERVRRETDERHATELARLRTEAEARLAAAVADARARTLDEARKAEAAAVDQAISRVRAEAAEHLTAQLAEADRLRSAAEERTQAEVERIKSGTAEQAEVQLRRARKETAAAIARAETADTARAQAAAAAEAVRTETEARHAAALTHATGELEAARQLHQAAQRDAESARLALSNAQAAHHSAIEQARAEAERESRARAEEAVRAEAARAESEGRHQAELERARQELNQLRQEMERAQAAHHSAMEQARADAERDGQARTAQAARAETARLELENRLQSELERANQELNHVRQEMERAQAAHHSAMEQARADGERDSRAWADEAIRADTARIEAESRHKAELEHAHQELTQLRQEMEQARAAHRSAMEQARADAERDSRSRAEEALRAETVRVELEGRHQEALERAHQELNHVRQEMERARAAHLSAIEQARAEAERDTRAWAEKEISTAAARLAADADARVASEIAAVRAEAEERRVAGLVALRAQLDQLTGNASEARLAEPVLPPAAAPVARSVAAPVAVEAADAEYEYEAETESEPEASPSRTPAFAQVAHLAARGGRLAAHGLRLGGQAALPVARRIVERVPARAAAVLLLVVGGLALVDVSALTQRGTSVALSASRKAVNLLGIGAARPVETKDDNAAAADAIADEAAVAEAEAKPVTSGLLQVNSRVPLDLYIAGKRVGSTGGREIVLPPGRHRVEFVSERLNYRGETTISIRSAAFTTHNVTLPMGSLLIETEPGAEVIVEGQPAGVAPLGVVSAPLGTCEVVVRHPELGERREVVEVRHGVTTELRVAFPQNDTQVADAIPPA
jgi:hypothetical protein